MLLMRSLDLYVTLHFLSWVTSLAVSSVVGMTTAFVVDYKVYILFVSFWPIEILFLLPSRITRLSLWSLTVRRYIPASSLVKNVSNCLSPLGSLMLIIISSWEIRVMLYMLDILVTSSSEIWVMMYRLCLSLFSPLGLSLWCCGFSPSGTCWE